MPVAGDSERLKYNSRGLDVDQYDDGCRNRNRRRSVHYDTQRAMVSIAIGCMYVRHLDYGEQRQKNEAHHSKQRQSCWLCAASAAEICLKSCQKSILCIGPYIKDTQILMKMNCSGLPN